MSCVYKITYIIIQTMHDVKFQIVPKATINCYFLSTLKCPGPPSLPGQTAVTSPLCPSKDMYVLVCMNVCMCMY